MTSLVFQTNNTCVLFYLKISKSVNICFPLIYVKLTVSLSYFFHSNSALLIFPNFFLVTSICHDGYLRRDAFPQDNTMNRRRMSLEEVYNKP